MSAAVHRLVSLLLLLGVGVEFFFAGAGAFGATSFHVHRVVGFSLLAVAIALLAIAGALAGLIVLLPFGGGAWGLNLMALLAYENNGGPDSAPHNVRVATDSERATAVGSTRQPALVIQEQERTVLWATCQTHDAAHWCTSATGTRP